MNLEKFVQSPYRALVMILVTLTLAFCDIALISHIVNNLPEKKDLVKMGHLWLFPSFILAYACCAATLVSFVMIFLKRPLKPYSNKGFIYYLILGLILGPIASLSGGLIIGLITSLAELIDSLIILGPVVGLIIGLMFGLDGEFMTSEE